jgi:hypothetical protein
VNNNRNGDYESDDAPEWAHLSNNARGTPTYRERIEESGRLKAANAKRERFVRLGENLTGSPAWKALGRGARDAYTWIERRYRKTNNGKIPMGARDLAEQMGVDKDTANRYLLRLQALGFIAPMLRGHFGDRSGARRATRWRLTEYSCNGHPPTRDYLNLSLVEANMRARDSSRRNPNRLHPGRVRPQYSGTTGLVAKSARPQNADVTSAKFGRVRPQNSDTDPVSVHGIEGFASAKFGQSTAVPGDLAAGAPERSDTSASPIISFQEALARVRERRG